MTKKKVVKPKVKRKPRVKKLTINDLIEAKHKIITHNCERFCNDAAMQFNYMAEDMDPTKLAKLNRKVLARKLAEAKRALKEMRTQARRAHEVSLHDVIIELQDNCGDPMRENEAAERGAEIISKLSEQMAMAQQNGLAGQGFANVTTTFDSNLI